MIKEPSNNLDDDRIFYLLLKATFLSGFICCFVYWACVACAWTGSGMHFGECLIDEFSTLDGALTYSEAILPLVVCFMGFASVLAVPGLLWLHHLARRHISSNRHAIVYSLVPAIALSVLYSFLIIVLGHSTSTFKNDIIYMAFICWVVMGVFYYLLLTRAKKKSEETTGA